MLSNHNIEDLGAVRGDHAGSGKNLPERRSHGCYSLENRRASRKLPRIALELEMSVDCKAAKRADKESSSPIAGVDEGKVDLGNLR